MTLRRIILVLVAASLPWWGASLLSATDYDLRVRLDPESGRLHASGSLRWTNTTAVAVDEVRLHLYLNAFDGPRTTFMRELYRDWWWDEEPWPEGDGWIRIDRLGLADGTDLLGSLAFVSPDDGNPDDRTVASVPLPFEILPGAAVSLDMEFEAQLPTLVARSGSAGDFHMVAQWFPKVGVLEEQGDPNEPTARWSCHQYHQDSEFYSDFGRYRVEITIPGGWVFGGTGVELTREEVEEGGASWQRLVLVADRVHDFAWCAAPAELMMVVEEEFDPALHVPTEWVREAAVRLGMSTGDLELAPVHLRLLVPRSQSGVAARTLDGVRLGLAWLGLRYGAYPYPQLTVVSPPPGAEGAGAMEYPTLITTGVESLQLLQPRGWDPALWGLIAHELAHQVFYGVLAFDEAEAPWLDEGLATYAENQFLTELAAEDRIRGVFPITPWTDSRLDLLGGPLPLRIDRGAWEFRTSDDYAVATYSKAALVLRTLEGLIGETAFARGLRRLVDDNRWGHPGSSDLQAALEQESGQELGWFFDQATSSDAAADWAVLEARSRPAQGLPEGDEGDAADGPATSGWESEVHLGRVGDLIGPVEVELVFGDGSSERRMWDGPERWVRWQLGSEAPISRVVIDPDGVWALEVRRLDNHWTAPSAAAERIGSLWWLRAAIRALGGPVLPWS